MHADATRAGGDVCVCVCTFAARGRTQSGPAEAGNALTHRAANTREKKVRVAAAWRPGPSEAAQILWLFFLSDARGALPQFLVFSFPLPHMPADYGAFSPLLLTDAPHTHTHTHTHTTWLHGAVAVLADKGFIECRPVRAIPAVAVHASDVHSHHSARYLPQPTRRSFSRSHLGRHPPLHRHSPLHLLPPCASRLTVSLSCSLMSELCVGGMCASACLALPSWAGRCGRADKLVETAPNKVTMRPKS
jgi:hypothetical protein